MVHRFRFLAFPFLALVGLASPGLVAQTSGAMPTELLVCENHGPCNAAWTLTGDTGTGTWFARTPARARLTVIHMSSDDIRIRRVDTTDGVAANYVGSLRGDHYSGTIIWSTPDHPGETTGTWTATVPRTACSAQQQLEPDEAMALGQTALMFKREADALNCYTIAAGEGNATAQTAVGLLYYQGKGQTPQDYSKAFLWLHKAADQGVYAAQRTVSEMYLVGQGTAPNAALSGIYKARADEQKHDLERRQDLADHAADRQAQMLSSLILGVSFGASLFF